jgi:hypothetical protein
VSVAPNGVFIEIEPESLFESSRGLYVAFQSGSPRTDRGDAIDFSDIAPSIFWYRHRTFLDDWGDTVDEF